MKPIKMVWCTRYRFFAGHAYADRRYAMEPSDCPQYCDGVCNLAIHSRSRNQYDVLKCVGRSGVFIETPAGEE